MDGVFRSTRYQNTFLMPNDSMVKELEEWVRKDEDDKAMSALRSVLLKKHFARPSALRGDVSTLQHGDHILADPVAVAKTLWADVPKMVVIHSRFKRPICYVHYFGDKGEFPKIKAGGSAEPVPLVSGSGGGGGLSPSRVGIAKITDSLKKGDPKKVLQNVEKAVAGDLAILHSTDKEHFLHAKYFLSANPIVLWFFLTLPGRGDALVTAEDFHKPSHPFSEQHLDLKVLMDEVLFMHDGSGTPRHVRECLTELEATNGDLYDVICMLTMDGVFRSTRYQNTFLMSNDSMVKELEEWVRKDEDDKAMSALRSVLLKKHFARPSALRGDVSTLQHGDHILADPVAVAKTLWADVPKMVVIHSRFKRPICYVHYFGDKGEFPKIKAGGSAEPVPLVSGSGGGGGLSPSRVGIAKITDSLKKGDPKKVLQNVEKAVAGDLAILHSTDKEHFLHAKYFLSANPIVLWFFLTLPGRGDALAYEDLVRADKLSLIPKILRAYKSHKPSHPFSEQHLDLKVLMDEVLFMHDGSGTPRHGLAWRGVSLDQNTIVDDTKQAHYDKKETTAQLHSIKQAYEDLVRADKLSLIPKILRAYKSHKPSHPFSEQHLDLKVLMDEVLFMHDGSGTPRHVRECLTELEVIDWSRLKHVWVICDADIYGKVLLSCREAFNSGPNTFVKSVHFLHVPLSKKMEESIVENMVKGGVVVGGNPDVKLAAELVKVLSKRQRELLLEQLKQSL
eukprot:jgi/Phyca11/17201/fgenesh1_pg.PHYCAscaffold_26_\